MTVVTRTIAPPIISCLPSFMPNQFGESFETPHYNCWLYRDGAELGRGGSPV